MEIHGRRPAEWSEVADNAIDCLKQSVIDEDKNENIGGASIRGAYIHSTI